MGRIVLLDEATINKIAAGEVVERPASVVKELLENALDAGAKHIRVQIENGGRDLIQVVDDGCGMDREDALLALERHATSKIRCESDLFSLKTLGFRGEALPSIAAVSNLILATCPGGREGTVIRAEGGRIVSVNSAGLPKGTRVSVSDLFYNTPARFKYMKGIPTETGHIKETVSNLALANPDVSFTLRHKDMELLFTPGDGDPVHALAAVYGSNIVKDLIPVEGERGPLKLSGFIGRPEIARPNRNQQVIILNGRWIRSRLVGSAVEKAFHTYLPIARFPFFFLSIRIDTELVDVNVHPAKLEVRFSDENEVFRQIRHAVGEALAKGMTPSTWTEGGNYVKRELQRPPSRLYQPAKDAFSPLFVREQATTAEWIPAARVEPVMPSPIEEAQPAAPSFSEASSDSDWMVLDRTYIVTVDREGLVITDQHAAHERILYERLMEQAERGGVQSQLLLQPLVVELTPEEENVVDQAADCLRETGFEIEAFGPAAVLLRAVPQEAKTADAADLLHQILAEFTPGSAGSTGATRDRIFATLACRNAIKAGDSVGRAEIDRLLSDLSSCRVPTSCPHGRPTQIKLKREEIQRMFRRA